MTPILDHEAYARSLTHSLDEKLFFIPHTGDASFWVDYGSADGRLMREASQRVGRPIVCLDYDTDARHLNAAHDWSTVVRALGVLKREFVPLKGHDKTAIVFSSVLHEVAPPAHVDIQRDFITSFVVNKALDVGADYIVIRDMAIPVWTRKADVEDVEWFLKEPWLSGPDAQREREESYFSVPADLGLRIEDLSEDAYRLEFERHYIPPAVRHRWWESGRDLRDLPAHTHMQLILKRSR